MFLDYSVFTGPLTVLIVAAICFIAVSVIAVVRTRKRRPAAGRESMIGQVATAYTALSPEGTVQASGELWHAKVRGTHVDPGGSVVIMDVEGLTLIVKEKEVTGD